MTVDVAPGVLTNSAARSNTLAATSPRPRRRAAIAEGRVDQDKRGGPFDAGYIHNYLFLCYLRFLLSTKPLITVWLEV